MKSIYFLRSIRKWSKASTALLLAALLAACGTPQASTLSTAAPEEDAAAAASQAVSARAASGPYRMLRGPWGNSDTGPLCGSNPISRGGGVMSTYLDLRTGEEHYACAKQDCPHSGAGCEAFYGKPDASVSHITPFLFAPDAIYWADGAQEFPAHVYKSGLDGKDKTLLYSLGDETVAVPDGSGGTVLWQKYQWDGVGFATDGAYYYHTVRAVQFTKGMLRCTTQLWKSDPATDTHEVLYETPLAVGLLSQNLLVGCTDDALILDELTEPADTGSLSENQNTAQHNVFLLARDGTKTPVYTYQVGDYAVPPLAFDNVLYCLSQDATTLQTVNLVTGEVTTVTQSLPAGAGATVQQPRDGYAFVDTLVNLEDSESVFSIVNLSTGEVTQSTLRYYQHWHPTPPSILAATETDYVVTMEQRSYTSTDVSPQGTPFTGESFYFPLAFISKEDYRAGNPNYREIAMLPVGE